MTLTFVSLFAGVGGADLGFTSAGWDCRCQVEINPYCQRVLAQHWPDVPRHGDIVEFNAWLRSLSMRSSEDSLAKTFLTRAGAPDYAASVLVCGGKCWQPFAWYDPASSSWRTWQLFLGGEWEPFSGTWPRAGMTLSGIAYQRLPLAPLTSVTASSLLVGTPTRTAKVRSASFRRGRKPTPAEEAQMVPTPAAQDGKNASLPPSQRGRDTLPGHVMRLDPTPTASPGRPCEGNVRIYRQMVEAGLMSREEAMLLLNGKDPFSAQGKIPARPLDPTPRADGRDYCGGSNARKAAKRNGTYIGRGLNPEYHEWLMGFPIDWTALVGPATPGSPR